MGDVTPLLSPQIVAQWFSSASDANRLAFLQLLRGKYADHLEERHGISGPDAEAVAKIQQLQTDIIINGPEEILRTRILSVRVDIDRHCGYLQLPKGCSCDMQGCLAFFLMFDTDVNQINVYVDNYLDVSYMRGTSTWTVKNRRLERLQRGDS